MNDNNKATINQASVIFVLAGFILMYYNYVCSLIAFIIGTILGYIYVSQTKKKFFGLTYGIIGMIICIILLVVSIYIHKDTMNEAKCTAINGQWLNGECIKPNEETKPKYTYVSYDDYIGTWSCKDEQGSTSISIPGLNEIDPNDYPIRFTFMNDEEYMIVKSDSEWEKGKYTTNLDRTETDMLYYILELTPNDSDIEKEGTFVVGDSYNKGIIILNDFSMTYSCYRNEQSN